ncbi:MAG TPA: CapA family protein [Thermoanaerobaculia bacterium]|nr:CapA family protein [Thermoanaerobaculia bacterium]
MNRREFLKLTAQGAAVAAASRVLPLEAAPPGRITLAAVGDCIITRKVSHRRDPDFLALAELLRGADVTWGNCELVLADSRQVYPALKGADPHVMAPPWGADELAWMGIDFMGMANNHILDFGIEGMLATGENLDRVGIAHAGAGADLAAAASPGYVDTAVGRIAQVNCASTFPPYFAAGPAHPYLKGRPGLNPVRLDQKLLLDRKLFETLKKVEESFYDLVAYTEFPPLEGEKPRKDLGSFGDLQIAPGDRLDLLSAAVPADLTRVTEAIKVARNNARLVVATIHAHEARHKLEMPDPFLQPFARACIDAGADAFLAAGPHVIRGIEIYKGKPIFYCLSNFFFQFETSQPVPAEDFANYGLDPRTLDPSRFGARIFYHEQKRFWRSFVPRITYEDGKVVEIEVHPVSLGFGQPLYERGFPVLARDDEAREILLDLAERSKPYGTTLRIEEGVGRVALG